MRLTYALAVATALISNPAIAEKLYILNTGSTGGSYNAQTQAWAKDLGDDYEVELIQSKGCEKALALISKIDGNILTMFSGNWVAREGCAPLMPTEANHLYTDYKIGLIFSRLDSTQPLLENGVTVAFNGNRQSYIQQIADANDIDLFPIEYKNSKEIVLAVLNGEVDFGYTDSAKHVWKNLDQLLPHYNLSGEILDGVPSVSEIGGKTVAATVNFLYFGDDKKALREQMQKEMGKPESAIGLYHDGQKGLRSYLMADPYTSYQAFVKTQ